MTLDLLKSELYSKKVKKIILDTDTFNEVDDQFALSYLLMRDDKASALAVTAAPFLNERSVSPEDGMIKSYNEIKHILSYFKNGDEIPVYKGARRFLADMKTPVDSEACDKIISIVMNSDETVYIVAIAAITNIASALIKCPDIASKAVLIWLGGHATDHEHNREFNLYQDIAAARVVFESGIPLVQLPCAGVVSEFEATLGDLIKTIGGKNPLSDYLVDIVKNETGVGADRTRILWDVAASAAIICPESLEMKKAPAYHLNDDASYGEKSDREILYVNKVKKDILFNDMARTLAKGNNLIKK